MNVQNLLYRKRPTWAEIDLNQLESNFSALRRKLGSHIKIMGVIKANAYGHGAVNIAQRLERCAVNYLAVAILEEGLELRKAGIRSQILLLNGFWPGQEEDIIQNDLTPAVFSRRMVQDLARAASRLQKRANCHIKIDTGMSRLGVDWANAIDTIEECCREEWTNCEGIYTHLSSAEVAENPSNALQIERFQKIARALNGKHFLLGWHHAANSAGLLNLRESWFDGVRPGLLLYGINPVKEALQVPIHPILSFKTRIMQLKSAKKGTSIGYGEAYTVTQESLIAILPIGYADGLDRSLSNKGGVLVQGHRAPIVGRISMDLTLIDVTGIKAVRVGDEVVLLGKQGLLEISANEIACLSQTIPYEVFCRISQRVPRIYLGS